MSVNVGNPASFAVVATGTEPLRCQWRKDGVDLPGETINTIIIGSTTLADAGVYSVVVSNAAGNVTSNAATLTIIAAPVAPSITTLTALYTVPAATSAVSSTLAICNRGAATTFRVAVRPAGASIDIKHYMAFDAAIQANDALYLTLGMSLATTDVVSVYAGSANLSFTLFGSEIT
jgi:hypothetical protein